jgi:hypothetical protein
MLKLLGLKGLLGTVAAVAVVAGGSYAFTASNTVPNTAAGQGTGTVSGYTVTSVGYTLNASTPSNIDAVTFTISPASATTVKAQLASGGTWYSCTNTAGSVSCATTSPQMTAATAATLNVVATG